MKIIKTRNSLSYEELKRLMYLLNLNLVPDLKKILMSFNGSSFSSWNVFKGLELEYFYDYKNYKKEENIENAKNSLEHHNCFPIGYGYGEGINERYLSFDVEYNMFYVEPYSVDLEFYLVDEFYFDSACNHADDIYYNHEQIIEKFFKDDIKFGSNEKLTEFELNELKPYVPAIYLNLVNKIDMNIHQEIDGYYIDKLWNYKYEDLFAGPYVLEFLEVYGMIPIGFNYTNQNEKGILATKDNDLYFIDQSDKITKLNYTLSNMIKEKNFI